MKTAACMLLIHPDSGLLRVVNRPGSELLGLPGGKVDPGETFLEAAVRETWEETGIRIDPRQVTELYEAVCPGEVDYLSRCYLAFDRTLDSQGQEPDIQTRLVTWDHFIMHCAFRDYNIAVRERYEILRKE